jgi:hypothetical protein
MSDIPEDRTEIVTTTWRAVAGPRLCAKCGHNHWGWQSSTSNLAPQWTWCDAESCDCLSLLAAAAPLEGEPE